MKIFKILFLATIFLGGNTASWATDTDSNLDPKPVVKMGKMGFIKTSDETLAEIKKQKKAMGLKAPKPSTGPLPKSVDHSRLCRILNQGNLGSCTTFAIGGQLYVRQAMQLLEKGKTLEKIKAKQEPISHLFLYYEERKMEGTINEDAGASIGDGMLIMYKKGAPREQFWPYDDGPQIFMQAPPAIAYAKASENRDLDGISNDLINPVGKNYELSVLKRALFDKQPMALGILLYDSFQSEEVARTGIIPLPKKGENCLGGHAVLCIGYDDDKKWFKFANSWGENWGDKGFFYLPYDYFKTKWVSEVWKMGTVSVQNIPLKANRLSFVNDNNITAEEDKKDEK